MNKLFSLILVFCIVNIGYSQINFERGYFINNSGQKTDCLIKDIGWKNNPSEFTYKFSVDSNENKASLDSIKEFGIFPFVKFIRAKVKIDRTSDDISKVSRNREPEFKEEILFLKVLVEGKANLSQYSEGNLIRFFMNTDDLEYEQLVYKKYIGPNDNVRENINFKQTLLNNLQCEGIKKSRFENIDYKTQDLVSLFRDYNVCIDSDYVNPIETNQKSKINISARLGLNNSSATFKQFTSPITEKEFESQINFRLGFELEFILPYNKGKWAILIEPTYQSYEGVENDITFIDYKSFEFPIGARHFFYLNKQSKLLANIAIVFDFPIDSSLGTAEIESGRNFAFGIGYRYNEKYSLELRYQTKRELLVSSLNRSTEYNTTSIIFGYNFLK